jgi:hypothetical protein
MIVLYWNSDDSNSCKTASKVKTAQWSWAIEAGDSSIAVFENPAADTLPYSWQLIIKWNECHWLFLSIVYAVWGDCDSCNNPDEITLEKMWFYIPPGTSVWALPNAYISQIGINVVDWFEGATTPATKTVAAMYTSQYALGCCEEVKVSK